MPSEEMREAAKRLRRDLWDGVNLSPRSAFDALLDARLNVLERQVDELKGRVNGLIFLVIAAVIVQIVIGLLN